MGRTQAPPSRIAISSVIGGVALCGLVWTQSLVVASVLVAIIGMGFGNMDAHRLGHDPGILAGRHGGRVMAIYTAIATATSLAGISFFGWMTELADESDQRDRDRVCVFLLGLAAALFSRRISAGGDSTDETEADPATVASGFA